MEVSTANIPTWLGVAASAALVLVAVGISWWQRLGLGREVAIAALRALVQLAAVGALLLVVFDKGGLPAAFGWLFVMVVIAGFVAGRRAAGIPRARQHAWWGIGVAVAATMGLLWFGSNLVYGYGSQGLGDLGFVLGWPLFMGAIVLTANGWGALTGEWSAAPGAAVRWLLAAGC